MISNLILKTFFFLCCGIVLVGCFWILIGLHHSLQNLGRFRNDLLKERNQNRC